MAAEWFGLKHSGYGYGSGWTALIEKATAGRAEVIALCRLLACLEKGTDRQSWRRVMPAPADYLTFIAANGYDLSDVEKRAAGVTKPKPARRARSKQPAPAAPHTDAPEASIDTPDPEHSPESEDASEAPTDAGVATPAA